MPPFLFGEGIPCSTMIFEKIFTNRCGCDIIKMVKKQSESVKNEDASFMKKILLWILMLSLLTALCSCDEYVSSYNAIGLVRSQTSHSCETSFYSLEGQLVFKIKKSDRGAEGNIAYSIQVDEGEIDLYYDIYGVKEELAHVKSGESVDDLGGYVEGGKTVYIIIEAKEHARGKVSIELDH